MFTNPSKCRQMGGKKVFRDRAPILLCATYFVEHDSLEMRLALSLLVYCKALKTGIGIQKSNGVGTVVVLIVLKNGLILAVL